MQGASSQPCILESEMKKGREVIGNVKEGFVGVLWLNMKVDGKMTSFIVDTGSSICVLTKKPNKPLKNCNANVTTAEGGGMNILGKCNMKCLVGNSIKVQEFFIAPDVLENIIGINFLNALNSEINLGKKLLVTSLGNLTLLSQDEVKATNKGLYVINDETSSQEEPFNHLLTQVQNLPPNHRLNAGRQLTKYKNVFREQPLGKGARFPHIIQLNDSRPVKQSPRRVSAIKKAIIDKEVKKMLEAGVIRPSRSAWGSPIVLVEKKDGEVRFCVDYRVLNEKTVPDAFPLPNTKDVLSAMCGSKYFSTVDLRSGFWQLPVERGSIDKTAFVIPDGHYEFVRMPFGLRNATATFQRAMTEVLGSVLHKGVEVFVDDVVMHAADIPTLIKIQEQVFHLLEKEGLTLKVQKCHLFQTEVEVLGHVVSEAGCTPKSDQLQKIKDWSAPITRKQVRQFLGLCSYYREHLKDFAKIAAPLHKLTSKTSKWLWSNREQESFEALRLGLTTTPVIKLFNPNLPVCIDCDASDYALGAVLTQCEPGKTEHVVAYYSKCLGKAESNYCVTRKELLAVLESLRHWRHLVSGSTVTIRSDHSSLKWLKSFKNPEGQLARWMEELSQYNIEIVHRPGIASQNADALSRRPCPLKCTYCSKREEREKDHMVAAVTIQPEVNWSTIQLADPELAQVLKWVETKQKPEWEEVSHKQLYIKALWHQFQELELNDGILIRKFHGNVDVVKQIIVPSNYVPELLKTLHAQGHFGIERGANSLKRRYYWHSWYADLTKHIRACVACNQRKGPQRRTKPPCKQYLSSTPLQRMAMDILGPLPLTERGNKYVLVCGDYFSKWMECIPIPNQESETIADALVEQVFSRFGIPHELHSDQGRNFESNVIKLVCQRFDINKTRTTPYHPQSDGLVERFNRSLLDGLSKVLEKENRWDTLVPLICMQYRASIHKATGCTPSLLLLGREIRMPLDVAYPPSQPSPYTDNDLYLDELEERIVKAAEFARRQLQVQWQSREKNCANHSRGNKEVDVSRPVYVFNPAVKQGKTPKFAKNWKGPFKVVEKISDYLYKIQMPGRNKFQVVHRSHVHQPNV